MSLSSRGFHSINAFPALSDMMILHLLCVGCPLVKSISPCVQIFPPSFLIGCSSGFTYPDDVHSASVHLFHNLEDQGVYFCLALALDLFSMVEPAERTKASAGIATEVLMAHKGGVPHQRQGIGTIVVGTSLYVQQYFFCREQHVF